MRRSILGTGLYTAHQTMPWWCPMFKSGNWQECLLRDHLPQANSGRLVTDISSGPICLKKKSKLNEINCFHSSFLINWIGYMYVITIFFFNFVLFEISKCLYNKIICIKKHVLVYFPHNF